MKTYIKKPKSVKINNIKEKEFSLTPWDLRHLYFLNNNFKKIEDLKNYENVWEQIDVINYLSFETWYNLWTISWMKGIIYDEKANSENISPFLYKKSTKKLSKWEIVISRNATLWKASYITTDIKCVLNWWLSNIFIKDEIKRFYVFWFFFSNFPSEQLKLITSWWWTQQNAKRQNVLDIKIPFPTINNHKEPEKIEKLVSLIVQNLIDKEEQIKLKNEIIDEKIEKELRKNQEWKELKYSFPRINEIKAEKRLDTWIYTRKYKYYENNIIWYKNWFYYLEKSKISPWVTPQDYHFSDIKKNDTFYNWITPKNIEKRQMTFNTFIHTNTKSKVKSYSLILNGIRYVWNGIFNDNSSTIFANQNTLIINQFSEKIKQLFLFCFLTSIIWKEMQMTRRNFWIVPILYTDALCKIPIPKFSDSKQEEIAKEYYNKVDKNTDLDFENYLEKEKKRNKELWIFQLNMELFSLREVLEDLVDKIVMDEKITISFDY